LETTGGIRKDTQYTIHVIENKAVLEFDTRMFRPCKPLPTIAISLAQLFDFSDIIVEWALENDGCPEPWCALHKT
jgi:hypothetical protein